MGRFAAGSTTSNANRPVRNMSMTTIPHSDFNRILTRFYGFSDGVVRWIRLRYQDDGSRDVELALACRDAEATENEGWVSVRILVRYAEEFTVREQANTTLQVLSEGIHLQAIDGSVAVEFGGALESPQTKSDLRKSDGFIIGNEIEIQVGPY